MCNRFGSGASTRIRTSKVGPTAFIQAHGLIAEMHRSAVVRNQVQLKDEISPSSSSGFLQSIAFA